MQVTTKIQAKRKGQKGWETISVSVEATVYDLLKGHTADLPEEIYEELELLGEAQTETHLFIIE